MNRCDAEATPKSIKARLLLIGSILVYWLWYGQWRKAMQQELQEHSFGCSDWFNSNPNCMGNYFVWGCWFIYVLNSVNLSLSIEFMSMV
jgi:hypothetical protein